MTELRRRLGLADAVTVGAGSMIGAGVFSAWSPATDAAGTGVLIALAVAAAVAFCNAASSAQLAAVHPESGGTYVYARRQLGPVWGYLAGWGFVVGKTASCVAIALTAGAYLWPSHTRLVGVAAVGAVAIVNIGGLTRTVTVTKCLLAVALVALASVVIAGWSSPTTSLDRVTPLDTSAAGVLRASGFLFFAFAGYARIATLGEEVRDPAITIPKAIPRALAGVLVVYAAIGITLLAAVSVDAISASDAPLGLVVSNSPLDALTPVVRVGAGIAALGVLLNLIPGVSRTVLAMARRGELPRWFATIDDRRSLPLRAEVVVAAVVIVLTATLDLRGAIGFSGVTVLTYYAITNVACLTVPREQRRWPRWVSVVGFAGCVALAVMLPLAAIIAGTIVFVAGIAIRGTASRARSQPRPSDRGE
jgi:APA family basic amino acid/polyamine antiporter